MDGLRGAGKMPENGAGLEFVGQRRPIHGRLAASSSHFFDPQSFVFRLDERIHRALRL